MKLNFDAIHLHISSDSFYPKRVHCTLLDPEKRILFSSSCLNY